MSEKETLDLEGAADLMDVGLATMRRLIDDGEIAATRLNRKHVCLLREDVIDFLRIRGRQQAEERRKARERKPRLARTPKPDLDRCG